jgi:hypothetical protein
MKQKSLCLWSALALLVATTACTKASPTRPSDGTASGQSSSVTDAVTGVTLTTASLITPGVNQQLKNVEQPITLTVKNAVTSGRTALTYSFEVATDAAFASKVYTKDGVAAGNGTTSLKIDKLTPNKSYFWRARAVSGSLNGPYTEVRGFGIGPEVILAQPVNGDPQPNATVGEQPTLNVNNAGRSGPNGPIFYRFEISETTAFTALVYSATVAERTDRPFTGHDVTTKLLEKTYYWRVIATDPANAVTSVASAPSAMTVQAFSLEQATILDSPDNFAFFAETARITTLIMGPNGINVDFTKKNGADRWPDIFSPGLLRTDSVLPWPGVQDQRPLVRVGADRDVERTPRGRRSAAGLRAELVLQSDPVGADDVPSTRGRRDDRLLRRRRRRARLQQQPEVAGALERRDGADA